MKGSTFGFGALALSTMMVSACGSGSGAVFGDGGAKSDDGGGGGGRDGSTIIKLDGGKSDGGGGTTGGCQPLTCEKLGYTCGVAGDGCGGKIDCGTCKAPATCGGGGKFSECGGTGGCKAKTCDDLGINCGPAGDGCGGKLACGDCSGVETCGGGGTPSVCGFFGETADGGESDGGTCPTQSCTDQSITCGPAGNGCGGTLDCGSCPTGETCGGGGTPYVCGANKTCTKTTCAALGFNCGPAADGCGGSLDCGDSCPTAGDICGGGGVPGVCGNKPVCTGLCADQVTCDAGATTSITGFVFAGTDTTKYGKADPVPNVLVYVPNATPSPFPSAIDCGCAPVTGDPLTSASTDSTGKFHLTNVPVPANGMVPIVIQLGRWRRFKNLSVPVTACKDNPAGNITMPHNSTEGDIPRTAISTGNVDAMECVLLKMGVDATEFTDPPGVDATAVGGGPYYVGPIHLYNGNGSTATANTPAESTLVPTAAASTALSNYDQVIFPCWGEDPRTTADNQKTGTQQTSVINYANAGGRVFATHFSYSWLYNDTPFSGTATWQADVQQDTGTANVQNPATGEPDVATFYQWIDNVPQNAATTGNFAVTDPRNDFTAISSNSELWSTVTVATGTAKKPTTETYPLIYTFQTPVPKTDAGTTQECGKVIYSDMHVSASSAKDGDTTGLTFPAECTSAAMSTQEKALEYLIWDLAACPPGPPAPQCTPLTCADQGFTCGPAGDGCGHPLDCGTCSDPCQVCGGGGTPSVCGGTCCVATTCAAQGIACGVAGDGCGKQLNCGDCPEGETCGGAGVTGQCVAPDGGMCSPLTCKAQGITCGPAGNGCGGALNCGTCPSGETCGGGGKSGVCGSPKCTPKTCAQLGFNCGPAGDGCGGMLDCGTCAGGVCGATSPGRCEMTAPPK